MPPAAILVSVPTRAYPGVMVCSGQGGPIWFHGPGSRKRAWMGLGMPELPSDHSFQVLGFTKCLLHPSLGQIWLHVPFWS